MRLFYWSSISQGEETMFSGKFVSNQYINTNVTDKNLNRFLSSGNAKVFISDSEITGAQINPDELANNRTLKKLCLTNCKIDQTTIGPLAQALISNTALTYLDLSGNDLGDEGVEFLLSCILKNPRTKIKTLILSDNKIDQLSPGTIKKLMQSQTLEELVLDNNPLKSKNNCLNQTLKNIFELLATNNSLTYLSIQHATIDNRYDSVLLSKLIRSLNQNASLVKLGLFEKEFNLDVAKTNTLENIASDFNNLRRSNSSLFMRPSITKETKNTPPPSVKRYNNQL